MQKYNYYTLIYKNNKINNIFFKNVLQFLIKKCLVKNIMTSELKKIIKTATSNIFLIDNFFF